MMAQPEMSVNMFAIDVVMPFDLVVVWPSFTPEYFRFIDIVRLWLSPEFEYSIHTRTAWFLICIPSICRSVFTLLIEELGEEEVEWDIFWDSTATSEE